jgi:hypothetical protein
MGFNLTDVTFYMANHFTNFLQTNPIDNMEKRKRKEEIMKVYNAISWSKQGICEKLG